MPFACRLHIEQLVLGPLNPVYRQNWNLNSVRTTLTAEVKQTFQVVALMATVCVVAIHYKSTAPQTAAFWDASPNAPAQEFLIGGLARFAVPMFAFAAGFFCFFSDDGSVRTYFRKLSQRARSVFAPYLVFACIIGGRTPDSAARLSGVIENRKTKELCGYIGCPTP